MVFSIICVLTVLVVLAVIIQNRSDGEPWAATLGDAAGALVVLTFLGGLLLVVSAGISSVLINANKGWGTQSEATYTVAENSNIVSDGNSIEFVASMNGKLENVKLYIDGDVVYAEDSEPSQTVTVREDFRELGTAIFPWGVGDFRTTTIIK